MEGEEKKAEARVPNLQIKMDEETAQGQYSNFAMLNHTPTEFLIDFIFMQPQHAHGKVLSRILLSPVNAKRLMIALGENLSKYEQRFGAIQLPHTKSPESFVH